MLAELLDQLPFNLAVADLYKTRFNGVPGVVYAAGVRHAYNVAEAFRDVGHEGQGRLRRDAEARAGARSSPRYERGDIDVLVNAQLLAEGWNSPRATVCMHLAPTASKRIYQQRVGRVTRRHPGKEAGIVVDFVHPATKHDDPVVTLHSLLDRDVYRGGAIVVGPVRRGRGRRLRVERRVLPVTADEERRSRSSSASCGGSPSSTSTTASRTSGPRWPARASRRTAGAARGRCCTSTTAASSSARFLLTAVQRNKNPQLRLRALQEIAAGARRRGVRRGDRRSSAAGRATSKREGVKVVLQALAEKKIGRRDQANDWIWRCANMTREVHEEYAVQRWPETKRLLGPARELLRRRPRAQRPPAGPRGAQAGPPPGRGAAGRRAAAHGRGRGGPPRRAHAHGPQAGGAGARAAAQLPEGQGPPRAAAAQEGQGRRRAAAAGGAGRRPRRRSTSRRASEQHVEEAVRRRRRRRRGATPMPDRAGRGGRGRAERRRTTETPQPKPQAASARRQAARRGGERRCRRRPPRRELTPACRRGHEADAPARKRAPDGRPRDGHVRGPLDAASPKPQAPPLDKRAPEAGRAPSAKPAAPPRAAASPPQAQAGRRRSNGVPTALERAAASAVREAVAGRRLAADAAA